MTSGRQPRTRTGDRRAEKAPALWQHALVLSGLVLVTALAYQPAWHGGVLWDDNRHMTSAALQSAGGVWRIWFELGATQQYYPLTHSAFWLLHRVAGDATTTYHAANILLHGASAFLVVCILRRLRVPGAVLAGALFAVHPVHVESVAWITELKNTLSGVLCLSAALAWVHFDERRDRASYAACLALFVCALLSKTVTAMLPVCLLILPWWRRGALDWRRDCLPLIPFLLLGGSAGALTAWVERTIIRAQGAEYDLGIVERCLVAGRATWFYLSKLAWPHPLVFIYPRWEVSDRDAAQFLYPLAAVAAMAALWALRHRARAPLAAAAMYVALLFPALGFFNVYPFRFSFVADHFQYLATVPMFALAAAGLVALGARHGLTARAATAIGCVTLVAPLAAVTFAESHAYADAGLLYHTTIARNPGAWIAHVNLGVLELDTNPAAAAERFRTAVRLKPDVAEAHSDLGNAQQRLGDLQGAVAGYREALRIDPDLPEARNNLANVLFRLGRPQESAVEAAEAVRLAPDNPDAHFNLGVALHALGKPEALAHFAEAVRQRPGMAEAHNYLGIVLQTMGRADDALAEYAETVRLQPDHAGARFNLANLLQSRGRFDDAIAQYRALIALTPGDAAAHNNLGAALEASGQPDQAAAEYAAAVRLDPSLTTARDNVLRLKR